MIPAIVGAALIGGATSMIGQSMANSANSALNSRALQHQWEMRKTAYQDTMADMRKAGLNPILAASRGATQPGGVPNMIPMQNVMSDVPNMLNSAANVSKAEVEIDNIIQDTEKKLQDMWTSQALEGVHRSTQQKINAEMHKLAQEVINLKAQYTGIDLANRLERIRTEFYERQPVAMAFKEMGAVKGSLFGPLDKILRDITGQNAINNGGGAW